MSLEVNITKSWMLYPSRQLCRAQHRHSHSGASGCGKSMTLRCIAGIVKPDAGRIVLDGRVLFDSAQHIDLRRSSAAWACCSRTTHCSPT